MDKILFYISLLILLLLLYMVIFGKSLLTLRFLFQTYMQSAIPIVPKKKNYAFIDWPPT